MSQQDARQQLEQLYARKRGLLSLLDHPGWGLLCEVIDGLVRARRQTDFGLSVKGLDDICALLTGRGEIAGMMLAKGLPDLLIGDLEADIQILLAEERVEKENSSE